MKLNKMWGVAIVGLLLLVDWLTFHDIGEVHTVRDWLTLGASLLVFGYLAKDLAIR